jgi:hypothetical protein
VKNVHGVDEEEEDKNCGTLSASQGNIDLRRVKYKRYSMKRVLTSS